MASDAIQILRAALRLSRKMPHEVLRRKFRFNAREMVEFYSRGNNSEVQLARGWRVLATMDKLLSTDPALAAQIFKPFEYMENVFKTGNAPTANQTLDPLDENVKLAE